MDHHITSLPLRAQGIWRKRGPKDCQSLRLGRTRATVSSEQGRILSSLTSSGSGHLHKVKSVDIPSWSEQEFHHVEGSPPSASQKAIDSVWLAAEHGVGVLSVVLGRVAMLHWMVTHPWRYGQNS